MADYILIIDSFGRKKYKEVSSDVFDKLTGESDGTVIAPYRIQGNLTLRKIEYSCYALDNDSTTILTLPKSKDVKQGTTILLVNPSKGSFVINANDIKIVKDGVEYKTLTITEYQAVKLTLLDIGQVHNSLWYGIGSYGFGAAVNLTPTDIAAIAALVPPTDISGKVDKVTGKSLVDDSAIANIHAPGSDNQDLSGYASIYDSRFTDARPPTAHTHDYEASGAVASHELAYSHAAIGNYLSPYRTLLDSTGSHTAAKAANTYGIPQGQPLAVTGTGTLYALNTIYLDPNDYPTICGKIAKLRVRCVISCNDVAPFTGTFVVGLHPVTRPATSGAAGLCIYTIGAAVSGSTVTGTNLAADSINNLVGNDFNVPAAGFYVLAVVTNQTMATSSHCHISASLQTHHV